MPMSRSAAVIAATASLSAASGARLKLIVTAGNCSWCAMTSGAVAYSKRAKAQSGTCVAPAVCGWLSGVAPAVSEVDCCGRLVAGGRHVELGERVRIELVLAASPRG